MTQRELILKILGDDELTTLEIFQKIRAGGWSMSMPTLRGVLHVLHHREDVTRSKRGRGYSWKRA